MVILHFFLFLLGESCDIGNKVILQISWWLHNVVTLYDFEKNKPHGNVGNIVILPCFWFLLVGNIGNIVILQFLLSWYNFLEEHMKVI